MTQKTSVSKIATVFIGSRTSPSFSIFLYSSGLKTQRPRGRFVVTNPKGYIYTIQTLCRGYTLYIYIYVSVHIYNTRTRYIFIYIYINSTRYLTLEVMIQKGFKQIFHDIFSCGRLLFLFVYRSATLSRLIIFKCPQIIIIHCVRLRHPFHNNNNNIRHQTVEKARAFTQVNK